MKILLATDGSRYARGAARFLRTIAPDGGAQVDVVSVLPSPAGDGDGAGQPRWFRAEDHAPLDIARGWVESAELELVGAGLRIRSELVTGDPEDAILNQAATGGYDLVVVGVKGRGAAPFFELGRVALSLVRRSPVSVLLVRDRMTAGPRVQVEPDFVRILIPTDGDQEGLEASWRMVEALSSDRSGVEIVSVIEPRNAVPVADTGDEPWGQASEEEAPLSRRWLDRTLSGLSADGAELSGALLRGRPASEIARWATAHKTDLIVLRSRGGNGSEDTGLGKTLRELAWSAPCSVLMVR
jgi:nucleotide-binding universal stress UspA family protein